MLAMSFGPLLGWKRSDIVGAAQRLLAAASACRPSCSQRPLPIEHGGPVLAPFGVGIAVFVMAGAVTDFCAP